MSEKDVRGKKKAYGTQTLTGLGTVEEMTGRSGPGAGDGLTGTLRGVT